VGQGSAPRQLAARIELHSIETLTLSDEQFLRGDSAGKPVIVSAELRIPRGSGRLPTVILIHGSGGIGANIDVWSREFNAMGFSTFIVDGFTGRGLTSVSRDQRLLGRLNLMLDGFRALGLLARHSQVDPERIVVMGFSRGGQATLYASLRRFHQMWNRSGIEFAAYIPFYPDCMTTYEADTDVVDRPIRVFLGGADDYHPPAPCRAYVDRLRSAGRDVQVTEYPNAPAGFDNPLFSSPATISKGAQTIRSCTIREEPTGVLVNLATRRPFTYEDACVETDPHYGYDAAAAEAATRSVKKFLAEQFKIN
jgi:dienelactone hydrolase